MKINLLFEEIDTNKDNKISMNELLAKFDSKFTDNLKKEAIYN